MAAGAYGAARRADSTDPWIGKVVDRRYRILERIARGGMSTVYRAEQVPLGRHVALKIVHVHEAWGDEELATRRFLRESTACAHLSHPHTIVIHDYGVAGERTYYLAMEFLAGRTVKEEIDLYGPMQAERAIHIGLQVCGSVADAHGHGMVHRDLKPSNLFLAPRDFDRDFLKVLDFGLVKMLDAPEQLTKHGVMMGSPRYMAPEQVYQGTIDVRTDVYGFGASLYYMLTGRPPFEHDTQFELMRAQVCEAPPRPSDVCGPGVIPPRLEALVLQCLAKEPQDRPPSMHRVALELERCRDEMIEDEEAPTVLAVSPMESGERSVTPRPRAVPRLPRRRRRRRNMWLPASVLALGLATLIAGWWYVGETVLAKLEQSVQAPAAEADASEVEPTGPQGETAEADAEPHLRMPTMQAPDPWRRTSLFRESREPAPVEGRPNAAEGSAPHAALDAERLEAERVEAQRVEAERVEAQRVEAQRLEAVHLEAE